MIPGTRTIRWLLLLAVSAALVGALPGCSRREEPKRVSLEPPAAAPSAAPVLASAPGQPRRLRVAIAAMISPKETFVSYRKLMSYIGKKSGMGIEFVQRKTYEEVNELLRRNLLDIAFVCTGAYVDGHEEFGMELLVAPVAHGETVYYSYTIVPADSPARSFADLEGGTFAFTDPMSNTGRLVPVYRLAGMKRTPDSFFESTIYTYSHDKSIEGVARKLVDGAAVDSLVWDYMRRKDPKLTSQTRILEKSDPFGIPPIVVSGAVTPELKGTLRELFLRMHEDAEGREILSGIMIDRFVVVDDRIYDSVRQMNAKVRRDAGR